MKDNTLLLVGAGVLAYFLLSKKVNAGGGDSGTGTPSYSLNYGNEQIRETMPIQASTKQGASMVSYLVNTPVAAMDVNRFAMVQYQGSDLTGLLDRYQQQSITTQEAARRTSPLATMFAQAAPNFMKALPSNRSEFATTAVTTASAIKGGVGWQGTLKNYKG